VQEGGVGGWDDPRLPTISGLRRRGYTPASIRNFCERVGVTKKDAVVEMGVLENSIREDLEDHAPRRMAVLQPLKLVIDNYPQGQVEQLEAKNHPKRPEMGMRHLPFSRTLYIECHDFMEDPPKKFFRLGPGREVRLRYAYYVTCTDVIKNSKGEVVELHCTYDPETRGGTSPDGRKIKGTIHWVSADHAFTAEVRLYDRLFTVPDPYTDKDFHEHLNPDSLVVLKDTKLEPSLADAEPEQRFQFERQGYFYVDRPDSGPGKPVFNRTVTLRDTWAKMVK
jgi:glutaminyl-tRNA synthetase